MEKENTELSKQMYSDKFSDNFDADQQNVQV